MEIYRVNSDGVLVKFVLHRVTSEGTLVSCSLTRA
jgi:hypothetical protein